MFWHLNPKKLIPFKDAHKRKIKEKDLLMYSWFGNYGISALTVAIEHCFSKNAKSEYLKSAIMSDMEDDKLTQEEIDERELRKMLFAEEMWIKQQNKKRLPETVIL